MTAALVAGLLAGWGVAIPLGPVGLLVLGLGLRGGLGPALAAAAGVASADLAYAAAAALAGGAVAGALGGVDTELRLASAAVLLAVAAAGLRAALRPRAAEEPARSPWRTYGRFLALTIVNPPTAAYFAALVAGLGTSTLHGGPEKAMFVAAAFAASLSWQALLALIGGRVLHGRVSRRGRLVAALAGNGIVVALALRIALG